MRMNRLAALLLLAALPASAQLSPNMQSWLKRLASSEFAAGGGAAGVGRGGRGGAPGVRWIEGGSAYTAIERSEIARYDTATGRRDVQISVPQAFTDFTASSDG